MGTDINKMNETELRDYIRKFADVVYNYDKLRDEELQLHIGLDEENVFLVDKETFDKMKCISR